MTNKVAERKLNIFLETGPKSTDEVYNHLNEKLSWGITMSELGYLLNKKARIVMTIETTHYWGNKP